MTNFENSIKRKMTHKKFNEILKQTYGDGKNTFKYTYGDVSSFLTWNRDKNGKILKLKKDCYTKGQNINDGHIYDWDQKKLSRITTDIVFIGENMSACGKPLSSDFWFQNARRHKNIIHTFFGTEAEGAYFTDIIKPDKRLHTIIGKFADGKKVKQTVLSQHDILKDHLCWLDKELDFIGANNPLLIVFGDDAEKLLNEGLDKNFIKKNRFRKIIKIYHYAYTYIKGGYEGYKNDTRKRLSEFITIPKKILYY
jgi:hypothetical protein